MTFIHSFIFIHILQDPGISNTQSPGSYPPYDDGLQQNVFILKPDGSGPIIGNVNINFSHLKHCTERIRENDY